MSKKNFTGGLESLLGEYNNKPKKQSKEITKSSPEGTKDKETRATFIVKEDLLEKLKAIAYWERKLIKEIIGNTLQEVIANYEKENGEIKPIPKN